MTHFILPVERIYQEIATRKPPQPRPPVAADVKPITLTRADVDAIIQRSRGASPEELEYAITHAKDLILTTGERQQLALDSSILSAQRACQANGRRENPGAQFISQTLRLLSTPYGLIEREWFETLLRTNVEAIAKCRTHRPPRCDCWREAREVLWHAAHTHGDDSPEAWTALQVWTILEELELSSRPEATKFN